MKKVEGFRGTGRRTRDGGSTRGRGTARHERYLATSRSRDLVDSRHFESRTHGGPEGYHWVVVLV